MTGLWTVRWVGAQTVRREADPLLVQWGDLEAREVAAGINRGDPFMVDPQGRVDARLTRFFGRSSFARLAKSTKVSYTNDYRVFFNFLWLRGRCWDAADHDDLFDFEDWRRRAPGNPTRIGGAKWNRELAALQRLFGWATAQGLLDGENPVQMKLIRGRSGDVVEVASARAKDVRSSNVHWLTPRAYRMWRDVGLRGYTGDERPDPSWRGRHSGRNAAFADVLFSSGLRRTEAASLLVSELPQSAESDRYVDARLGAGVTKSGRSRTFYLSVQALRDVEAYIATSRRSAIRLAQRSGRYDDVAGVRVVTHQAGRDGRIVHWHDRDGQPGRAGLDNLDPEERRLLFVARPSGIEPLWLWLAEDGTPLQPHSWEAIFRAGSQRCAALLVGKVADPPFCTPHMCRHSFALHMLVALHHAMDRKFGLSVEERRDYRLLYGDPWRMVKDLLGHASEQTTRDIYLAPVADLQIRSLLTDDDDPTITELLTRIGAASERILDREDIA